jgi:hypothetical protein
MKFVPGTRRVIWEDDPPLTAHTAASARQWRAQQAARAENGRRNSQQLTAAGPAGGAATPRGAGQHVQGPRLAEEKLIGSLIGKLVRRLAEILTPAESKRVTVASTTTRYPLVAPPAVERKIYSDPVAQILLTQLGRKLAAAEQAAACQITRT